MRDALGGSVTIVIIVVFIVIVLGYLAFNVNYTKAFRMKNKIISTYEEYEGKCGGVNSSSVEAGDCYDKIVSYAREVGYQPGELDCGSGWEKAGDYYCYREIEVKDNQNKYSVNENGEKKYYMVATKINIEIPIINNILNLKMFWVTGNTKTFTINN